MVKAKMGFWTATSLVIGTVIGSGIFMLPAVIASYGGIGIVGWAVSGLGALALALVFARLSRIFPKAGGPYTYSRNAFGDIVGFQVATSYWVRGTISVAAIALVGASYFVSLFPSLQSDPAYRTIISLIFLWGLTGLNLLGVKPVGIFQIITSAVKIIPLVFMSTVGLFFIKTGHFEPFNISGKSSFDAIAATAAVTFFSLMGMESATVPSDDVESPEKTIPRATIFGTSLAICLYLLSAIAILGIVPLDTLSKSSAPFSLAMEGIFGPTWAPFFGTAVSWCAVVSCIGALNGYLLLQGKMPVATARDKLFPRIFMKETKSGAPWFGLLTCGVGATILLLLTMTPAVAKQFEKIVLMASVLGLFVYAYSCLAEVVVMMVGKIHFDEKEVIKSSFIALIAFVFCLAAVIGAGSDIAMMAVIFMLVTIPLYAWVCWKTTHAKSAKKAQQSLPS